MRDDELIDEVRANIERPFGAVTFTPALEEHYRSVTSAGRRRTALVAGGIGLAILQFYIAAAIATLEGETLSAKLRLYFGIDLFVVGVLVVIAFSRLHRTVDGVLVGSLVGTAVGVCLTYFVGEAPRVHYEMMSFIFVPVVANSMLRLLFRQALTVTVLSLVVFLATLSLRPGVPLDVWLMASMLVIACSAMTLYANYRSDHDERRAFLYLTREQWTANATRRRADELRELSTLDPLTSIANRRGFEERYGPLVAHCRTEGRPLAVVMIDIDHFKAFNDRYGHPRGDACLRSVAQTLAGQLRGPEDIIARMGGEEFAVAAPGLAGSELSAFLQRLAGGVARIAVPHAASPVGRVTVSMGCAVAHAGDPESWVSAVTRADRALYRAKDDGRDRWIIDDEAAAAA